MKDKKLSRSDVPPNQLVNARKMRLAMTEPECKLWKALRWRVPIEMTQFRRQVPIGPYIVDFCSLGEKLIIEVDGNQHGTDSARLRDDRRSAFLEGQGFQVLRFSNHDVMLQVEMVLDTIAAALAPPPTPNPSPQGGGESKGDEDGR
jgi:very-short-patch-repair endonuclease